MWETEQFLGTIDFHNIYIFPTMEVNSAPKQPGYKFSFVEYLSSFSEERN